jgi:predicted ATPase
MEIYIDGFDNIVDTRIKLSELTALLAVNNYGKSNLLSAIKAGLTLPGMGKQSQRRFINSIEHISLNKQSYRVSEASVRPFTFEIVFKTVLQGKTVNVRYNYSIRWMKGIETECLRVSENGSNGRLFLNRESGNATFLSSEQGRCDRRLLIDTCTLAITTLSYLEDKYTFHELSNIICGVTFPLFDTLDTVESYNNNKLFFSDSSDLLVLSRTNIKKALFILKEIYPKTFKLIENTFITLFPQYLSIIVEKISSDYTPDDDIADNNDDDLFFNLLDEEYFVVFTDKYLIKPVAAEQLSNGTRRLLSILINTAIARITTCPLLGIEEIETSIHPAKIGDFLDVLIQLAPECKFIVTSHSPSVTQYIRSDALYVGQPRFDGYARFLCLPKENSKIIANEAKQFGMTVGEMIFNQMSSGSEADARLSSLLEG